MKINDRIRTKEDGRLGTIVGFYPERIWIRGIAEEIEHPIVVLDEQGWRSVKKRDQIELADDEVPWP